MFRLWKHSQRAPCFAGGSRGTPALSIMPHWFQPDRATKLPGCIRALNVSGSRGLSDGRAQRQGTAVGSAGPNFHPGSATPRITGMPDSGVASSVPISQGFLFSREATQVKYSWQNVSKCVKMCQNVSKLPQQKHQETSRNLTYLDMPYRSWTENLSDQILGPPGWGSELGHLGIHEQYTKISYVCHKMSFLLSFWEWKIWTSHVHFGELKS